MTRFELAESRVMDTNLEIIDKVILEASELVTEDGKTVTIHQLRTILRESKQLVLTPF